MRPSEIPCNSADRLKGDAKFTKERKTRYMRVMRMIGRKMTRKNIRPIEKKHIERKIRQTRNDI